MGASGVVWYQVGLWWPVVDDWRAQLTSAFRGWSPCQFAALCGPAQTTSQASASTLQQGTFRSCKGLRVLLSVVAPGPRLGPPAGGLGHGAWTDRTARQNRQNRRFAPGSVGSVNSVTGPPVWPAITRQPESLRPKRPTRPNGPVASVAFVSSLCCDWTTPPSPQTLDSVTEGE